LSKLFREIFTLYTENNVEHMGHAIARRPGFDPRSGRVGFVVDKVALGKVFSEYFGFPCQFSFH
jgi:hypothetical protein